MILMRPTWDADIVMLENPPTKNEEQYIIFTLVAKAVRSHDMTIGMDMSKIAFRLPLLSM